MDDFTPGSSALRFRFLDMGVTLKKVQQLEGKEIYI
jgi:hypothetical protein